MVVGGHTQKWRRLSNDGGERASSASFLEAEVRAGQLLLLLLPLEAVAQLLPGAIEAQPYSVGRRGVQRLVELYSGGGGGGGGSGVPGSLLCAGCCLVA